MNLFDFLYYKGWQSGIRYRSFSDCPMVAGFLVVSYCQLALITFINILLARFQIIDFFKSNYMEIHLIYVAIVFYLNYRRYRGENGKKICEHYRDLAETKTFYKTEPIIIVLIYIVGSLAILFGGVCLVDCYLGIN